MTLQVNVIVFGVTLVVAVGSIIYNLMVHKRQAQRISYDRPLPPPRAPDGEQPSQRRPSQRRPSQRRPSQRRSSHRREGEDCSICLKKLNPLTTLPCGHVYHTSCISEWMSYSNTCPLCRKEVRM